MHPSTSRTPSQDRYSIMSTPEQGSSASTQNSNRDPAWQYGFLADPKVKNNVTCIFCQKDTKGGIYRLKMHLIGGDTSVKACPKVPDHVREEIEEYTEKRKAKRKQLNLVSEFDSRTTSLEPFDDDDDMDDEQLVLDRNGKRPISYATTQTGKKQAKKGPIDSFFRKQAPIIQSKGGRQTTINEAYKKEARAKMCEDIARFVYTTGIPFHVLGNEEFIKACDSIAKAGRGAKPPSPYELREPLLKKEVERVNEHLKVHREEWEKTGCSIISDGWTDRCQRSMVNFLVNSSRGSMFLESVDASNYSKTATKLFELLSKVVEQVGANNVVQVISDNGANFVAAGKFLEAKYPHMYWTPCAAHCVDLILEDIGNVPAIDKIIKKAIQVTSYIYGRPYLLNLMRKFTQQKNLLRPGKTRFATSFITLSSLHDERMNLRKLFQSTDFLASKYSKEVGGKKAAGSILSDNFWNMVLFTLKVTAPLVRVLRLADSETKPSMGYIYEAMDRAKEAIAAQFNGVENKYAHIFEIIDKRWECQLHHPLHAAGFFLNPEFFYEKPEEAQCEEVMQGLLNVVNKLIRSKSIQDKVMDQISAYKQAEGLFGNDLAIRHRKTKAAAEWWSCYGASTPELQQFAIKVLSLTCSASGCERNWSTFEHIHSKKRNRLHQKRLNDLVYVKYNIILLKRYEMRHRIDPISLADIDEASEWLTGKHQDDDGDELVYEDDETLTWRLVSEATGANEERFNLRTRGNKGERGASSSSRAATRQQPQEEEEEEEEDDEIYTSNVPMLNEDFEPNLSHEEPILVDEDDEGLDF